MAENREGARGEGTQVRAEQREPGPDNEHIIRPPEENAAGPIVSASGQIAGDMPGKQVHPGETATGERHDSP